MARKQHKPEEIVGKLRQVEVLTAQGKPVAEAVRVVRHGRGPERQVQTGIGPVAVQRVKLRDRGAGEDGERIRFTSAILPRWARRTRSLDTLLPILYLRGVSMGDFQEALAALLGRDAPNLSPSVIGRLRGEWEADQGLRMRFCIGWAWGSSAIRAGA